MALPGEHSLFVGDLAFSCTSEDLLAEVRVAVDFSRCRHDLQLRSHW